MTAAGQPQAERDQGSQWKAYVLPFAALIALLELAPWLGIGPAVAYPVRAVAVLAALAVFSRGLAGLRPGRPLAGALVGLAAFAVWIAPDVLFPGYRHFWLIDNPLTRVSAAAVTPPALRTAIWYLCFRTAGAALPVAAAEELFWRGWLMRWLISSDVAKIPFGTYSPRAFWLTAVLFASEHGAFWDVGLATGILYNWWMIRTRRLGDCILAHAVTNAALGAYVIAGGHWQYWT